MGKPVKLNGEMPKSGSPAPDFHLVNKKLKDVRLVNYKRTRKLFYTVQSLDTDVCAATIRTFERLAQSIDEACALFVVSADLPFAMSRFCKAEGIKRIKPLSMMRTRGFAKDYGLLIEDGPLAGVLARAVVVIDENDEVVYTELVGEITDEPDYERALAALA